MTQVRFEVGEGVGHVLLDGPDTMNSITPVVLASLEGVLDQVEGDSQVRVLVIRGAGAAFSVGMDIDFLGDCFADPAGVFVPFTTRFHALLDRLEALPVPVVAAVNGLARAGGLELLLACDLVVAADSARVADHHIEFGIVPGAGATVRAVRKLGDQRARELLFTGRWFTGAEMVEHGLAIRAVPADRLDDAVADLAGSLSRRSPECLASMKLLVGLAGDVPQAEALAAERAEFARFHAEVPCSAEGYRAWVEKRDPVWTP